MIGIVLADCGKATQDVTITGYDLRFPIPKGWTLTRNDGTDEGTLCVLIKRDEGETEGPTICIWVGNYHRELAEILGIDQLSLLVLIPVSGGVNLHDALQSDIKVSIDFGNVPKSDYADVIFKVEDSDVVASVMSLSQRSRSETFFTISVAANRENFDETLRVANNLATRILTQLNALTEKLEE